MEERERFEKAQSLSEEIQHSTAEPVKPEDLYNPIELSKENKPSTGERVRGWIDAGKTKVERFNERYPTASKYAGYAAKGVSFAARNTVAGRAYWAASKGYDAYQYGKQVWHYIEEAKAVKLAEEKAAKGKAFYEKPERIREREATRLERDLKHAEDTGKYVRFDWSIDEWSHTNQREINRISGELSSVKSSRSLEEVLSKNPEKYDFTSRFNQSRDIAHEYRQTMMNGSAQDKYYYLLDEARRELGDGHFDIAKHPQRATNFDAFAAKRLYEDGVSKEAVKRTIEEGAFYPSLPKSTSPAWEYGQRTYGAINPESDVIHQKVIDWQLERADQLNGAKINPEELPKLNEFKDRAKAYEISKTKEVRELASNTLARYKADGERWEKITTNDEYLIENGRRIEAGKTPSDKMVVNKLILAGHKDEHIVGALQEYSPKMNNSQRLSNQFLDELNRENQKSLEFKRDFQEAINYREKNSISEFETRLDRLNLSYNQKEQKLFENNTKNVMDSTSEYRRESTYLTQNSTNQRTNSDRSSGRDRSEIER